VDLPSTKPYLIRAIHEWCSDNGFTPYLAVAVDSRTVVPREYVRDGQIVLNVAHDATGRLQLGNDFIEFQARFGGVARDLVVPVGAVSAIYARENGAGMSFDPEPVAAAPQDDETPPPAPPAPRPRLQRVK
jgi:stringent starvation protein B